MSKEGKEAICHRFSKAALTYDEYALVQKKSAKQLIDSLAADFVANEILEIGCGTGNYTRLLANRFKGGRITSLDFAKGMVDMARQKCLPGPDITFLHEDGETFLVNSRQRFDLITSNATMQWFDDLPVAFGHISRILTSGGVFHASFFGPKTMEELGQGLATLFEESVTLAAAGFVGKENIAQMARNCFLQVELTETVFKRRYESLLDLLSHIKKTGTGGYQQSLPMITSNRRRQLEKWFSDRGGYEMSYQVFFLTASLPKGGSN